jgi:hypothetical protein
MRKFIVEISNANIDKELISDVIEEYMGCDVVVSDVVDLSESDAGLNDPIDVDALVDSMLKDVTLVMNVHRPMYKTRFDTLKKEFTSKIKEVL